MKLKDRRVQSAQRQIKERLIGLRFVKDPILREQLTAAAVEHVCKQLNINPKVLHK